MFRWSFDLGVLAVDMGLLSRVEPPIVVTLKSFHKTCAKVFTLKKYILLLKAARTAASRSRGMPGKPLDVIIVTITIRGKCQGNLQRSVSGSLASCLCWRTSSIGCPGKVISSVREDINEKKTFSFGHCPNEGGGGLPMPEFLALFQEVHFWSIKRVYFFKNANVLNF